MSTTPPAAFGIEPIRRFTSALADAAGRADLGTHVPTCGAWTLGDLVRHLGEVQHFWSYIIANRPAGPADYDQPPRPQDGDLVANLRDANDSLVGALAAAAPNDEAWSWAAEQTVRFTLRRQTHEALTHCVDGLLALDKSLPEVAPELAADGIDEMVQVMLEPNAESADIIAANTDSPGTDAPGTVMLAATDTSDTWTITVGQGDCTITGRALDLNLWLWGRGDLSALTITGAAAQADALRSRITASTQ